MISVLSVVYVTHTDWKTTKALFCCPIRRVRVVGNTIMPHALGSGSKRCHQLADRSTCCSVTVPIARNHCLFNKKLRHKKDEVQYCSSMLSQWIFLILNIFSTSAPNSAPNKSFLALFLRAYAPERAFGECNSLTK